MVKESIGETFDLRPLDEKVSFGERFARGNRGWLSGVAYLYGVASLVTAGVSLIPDYSATGVIAAITFGLATVLSLAGLAQAGNDIKLRRFAYRNFLINLPDTPYDNRPGGAFEVRATQKSISDRLVDIRGRFSEIGTMTYVPDRIPKNFGFIRIQLARHLPHIILSKGQHGNTSTARLGGVPVSVDPSQRLSLEGNFDDYFTLYTPKKYESDALYVFTPDVMQILMEGLANYDCEIIDNNFYIYSDKMFEPYTRKGFEEIIRLLDAVKDKIEKQTSLYNDDKINDKSIDEVTEQGQRLQKRKLTRAIIFLAIAATVMIATQILL